MKRATVAPFMLEYLPLKQSPNQQSLLLLEYAPYVLTGIFRKSILDLLLTRL